MKLRAAGTFGGGPPAGGFVAVGSKACGPVFNFAAAAAAARALREGAAPVVPSPSVVSGWAGGVFFTGGGKVCGPVDAALASAAVATAESSTL